MKSINPEKRMGASVFAVTVTLAVAVWLAWPVPNFETSDLAPHSVPVTSNGTRKITFAEMMTHLAGDELSVNGSMTASVTITERFHVEADLFGGER